MNDKERLELIKGVESTADSCIHELSNLMDDNHLTSMWIRISDRIQDYIGELEASIEYKDAVEGEEN
jgi:hypothetical protein